MVPVVVRVPVVGLVSSVEVSWVVTALTLSGKSATSVMVVEVVKGSAPVAATGSSATVDALAESSPPESRNVVPAASRAMTASATVARIQFDRDAPERPVGVVSPAGGYHLRSEACHQPSPWGASLIPSPPCPGQPGSG